MKQGTRIFGLASPVVFAFVALVFSAGSQAQVPSESAVRDSAITDIQNAYALLFEHLAVTPSEQDALVEVLVEDRMGRTASTDSSRGESKRYGRRMSERERTNKIADIIGSAKLQKFLTLEENLVHYGEIGRIASVLQQNDAPLTNTQRDELFEIILQAADQQKMPPAELERGSNEYVEHLLAQRDEYEHYIVQLAPSVLTPEQLVYLDEHYRYQSHMRGRSLNAESRLRADPLD